MDKIKIECPNCKAPLNMERGRSHMFCEYCGTKVSSDDAKIYAEDAKTERLRVALNTVHQLIAEDAERKERERPQRMAEERKSDLLWLGVMLLMLAVSLFMCLR